MTGRFESGFRKEGVAVSTSPSLSLSLSRSFVTFAERVESCLRARITNGAPATFCRCFLSIFFLSICPVHSPLHPPMISRATATLRALTRPLAH